MTANTKRIQQSLELQEKIIEPAQGWLALELDDLWRYRELLYFLTWRDIKVRYKQTALGAAWAILQPLLTMVLFSVVFGYFAGLPSEGIPYPVFTLTALLPWQLFAYALTQSSTSLVNDKNLITKIYFPRLVIPLSSVLSALLDFAITLLLLVAMLLIYRIPLTWRLLTLPLFILFALVTAMSVSLWLSALNVQYRDVRYTLPFLTQFWMYATPIAYSATIVPERFRWLYSLNPMTGVVEGFRWALLGTESLIGLPILISVLAIIAILVGGVVYFKRMEDSFADVV
ncbi:MAG: ABC transporter permease [Anaerolineales bacterium]|jgi:lipopolysaccharide transport system permease protein